MNGPSRSDIISGTRNEMERVGPISMGRKFNAAEREFPHRRPQVLWALKFCI